MASLTANLKRIAVLGQKPSPGRGGGGVGLGRLRRPDTVTYLYSLPALSPIIPDTGAEGQEGQASPSFPLPLPGRPSLSLPLATPPPPSGSSTTAKGGMDVVGSDESPRRSKRMMEDDDDEAGEEETILDHAKAVEDERQAWEDEEVTEVLGLQGGASHSRDKGSWHSPSRSGVPSTNEMAIEGNDDADEGHQVDQDQQQRQQQQQQQQQGIGGADDAAANGRSSTIATTKTSDTTVPPPLHHQKYPLRTGGGGNFKLLTQAPLQSASNSIPKCLSASSTTKVLFPVVPKRLLKSVGEAIRDWDMIQEVVPKKLLESVGEAIRDWDIIQEGDRLCLGLSGGKDSLTLLHILLALQKRAPINFTVAAATVDPQTPSFDPRPLIPYMKALDIPYHFLSDSIIESAKSKLQGNSLCAFCSRMKRGLLYSCCKENGYNKLILAQHLDDLVESLFMSLMHNGQTRTMKANYVGERGIRVIRPLVYTREVETKAFAQGAQLPIINENCPACFEQPKERARIKKMLSKEESIVPRMYANLRKGLIPLMDGEIYTVIQRKQQEIDGKKDSRLNKHKVVTRGSKGGSDASSSSRTTIASPSIAVDVSGAMMVIEGEGRIECKPEGEEGGSTTATTTTTGSTWEGEGEEALSAATTTGGAWEGEGKGEDGFTTCSTSGYTLCLGMMTDEDGAQYCCPLPASAASLFPISS